jgi:hypothetical protein
MEVRDSLPEFLMPTDTKKTGKADAPYKAGRSKSVPTSKKGSERSFQADSSPWLPNLRNKPFSLAVGALVLLYLLLCAAGIHGFSLASWHYIIDQSKPGEVLFGEPRFIRADDWAVDLPLALSQREQDPRFPVSSKLLGQGNVDVRLTTAPAKYWVTIFRPQTWGFFAGRDFGLAWKWWFRIFALAGSMWLVFMLLSGGQTWMSFAGAITLLFSPFYHFWSFNSEPLTSMMGLCFFAAVGLAFARSRSAILAFGLLLGWSGGCFGFCNLYPPYQIPLAYLFLVLAGSYFYRHRSALRHVPFPRLRLLVAACAALLVLVCLAVFFIQNREIINLLGNTVYPGQRRLSGGDVTFQHFFNAMATGFLGAGSFTPLTNICEAGSFLFLFPLTLGFTAWEWVSRRRRPDPVLMALGGFLLIIVWYALAGFPSLLARITLLSNVQGIRGMLPAGVASMMVTICFLSAPRHEEGAIKKRLPVISGVALWVAFVVFIGWKLMKTVGDLESWMVIVSALAAAGIGLLMLLRHHAALVLLAAMSFFSCFWFNPVARGGTDYLWDNQLSKKIVELDQAVGGNSLWAVYNDRWLGNLFRGLGVRCVNGVHFYPQFDFWAQIDPKRERVNDYNRYAHLVFDLPRDKNKILFAVPIPDLLVLQIHPETPTFSRLGLDYLIFRGNDNGVLRQCANLTEVSSFQDLRIFRVAKPHHP